jgi:DUF1680 family protein
VLSWTGEVALALRIPDWAQMTKSPFREAKLKDGYLYLPKQKDGNVELTFDVEPRRVYANPITGKNEICIMRGPLVYCVEDVDNDLDIDQMSLLDGPVKDGPAFKITGDEIVPVVARGRELNIASSRKLYSSEAYEKGEERDVTLIPFYARANRGGKGGMRVWCFKD